MLFSACLACAKPREHGRGGGKGVVDFVASTVDVEYSLFHQDSSGRRGCMKEICMLVEVSSKGCM